MSLSILTAIFQVILHLLLIPQLQGAPNVELRKLDELISTFSVRCYVTKGEYTRHGSNSNAACELKLSIRLVNDTPLPLRLSETSVRSQLSGAHFKDTNATYWSVATPVQMNYGSRAGPPYVDYDLLLGPSSTTNLTFTYRCVGGPFLPVNYHLIAGDLGVNMPSELSANLFTVINAESVESRQKGIIVLKGWSKFEARLVRAR